MIVLKTLVLILIINSTNATKINQRSFCKLDFLGMSLECRSFIFNFLEFDADYQNVISLQVYGNFSKIKISPKFFRLRSLKLDSINLAEFDFTEMTSLINLNKVEISANKHFRIIKTKNIGKFFQVLQHIKIFGFPLNKIMYNFKEFPAITDFVVDFVGFNEFDFSKLSPKTLTRLNIKGVRFTEKSLGQVKKLAALDKLTLENCLVFRFFLSSLPENLRFLKLKSLTNSEIMIDSSDIEENKLKNKLESISISKSNFFVYDLTKINNTYSKYMKIEESVVTVLLCDPLFDYDNLETVYLKNVYIKSYYGNCPYKFITFKGFDNLGFLLDSLNTLKFEDTFLKPKKKVINHNTNLNLLDILLALNLT